MDSKKEQQGRGGGDNDNDAILMAPPPPPPGEQQQPRTVDATALPRPDHQRHSHLTGEVLSDVLVGLSAASAAAEFGRMMAMGANSSSSSFVATVGHNSPVPESSPRTTMADDSNNRDGCGGTSPAVQTISGDATTGAHPRPLPLPPREVLPDPLLATDVGTAANTALARSDGKGAHKRYGFDSNYSRDSSYSDSLPVLTLSFLFLLFKNSLIQGDFVGRPVGPLVEAAVLRCRPRQAGTRHATEAQYARRHGT